MVKRLPCSPTCPPLFPEPPLRPFTAAHPTAGRADSTVDAPLTSRPLRFPRCCLLHHLAAVQTKFLVFNIVGALGSQTRLLQPTPRGSEPGYWPFRLVVIRGGKLSRAARDPWPPHFATPRALLHKNRRPHGSGLQFNGFIVPNFQLTP
jgi:hypothetical protein